MCVAPSSACCWMVVMHSPPSPASPPSPPATMTVVASRGAASTNVLAPLSPLQPRTSASALAASALAASALAAPTGHPAIDFTLALPFLGVFTFVPTLLAVNQRQLGLHAPLLFIQRQGDQRAPFLAYLSRQAIDLTPA